MCRETRQDFGAPEVDLLTPLKLRGVTFRNRIACEQHMRSMKRWREVERGEIASEGEVAAMKGRGRHGFL